MLSRVQNDKKTRQMLRVIKFCESLIFLVFFWIGYQADLPYFSFVVAVKFSGGYFEIPPDPRHRVLY